MGINEGRTPCGIINTSCKFEPSRYLELHPDVKKAGVDAKEHLKYHGINEKRNIC